MNQEDSGGAVQMLIWAIEEIEKSGNKEAEGFVRRSLKCLQTIGWRTGGTGN